MSEPCRHERDAAVLDGLTAVRVHGALGAAYLEVDALRSALAVTGANFIAATRERDAALDALGRVGGVLFMHSHADRCPAATSPDAGYECSCWRAGIYAALEPTS